MGPEPRDQTCYKLLKSTSGWKNTVIHIWISTEKEKVRKRTEIKRGVLAETETATDNNERMTW